ncbi:hypothetical protein ACBR55_12405 [Salinicoccus roseus]|uniref:hypothetical protein n=1 Tax=Salinicoccus roseus TaxID=45670 RepID=UPI00352686D4
MEKKSKVKAFKDYWIQILLALFILLVGIPWIIAFVISSSEGLANMAGNSSIWIGFWGSYLGGVIGTLGVIYVAYTQRKDQIKSMEIIESNSRERLRLETELYMLREYKKNVDNIRIQILLLNKNLLNIIEYKGKINDIIYANKDTVDNLENYYAQIHKSKSYIEVQDSTQILAEVLEVQSMNLIMQDNLIQLQKEGIRDEDIERFKEVVDFFLDDDSSYQMSKELFIDENNRITGLHEIYSWLSDETMNIQTSMRNILGELGKAI